MAVFIGLGLILLVLTVKGAKAVSTESDSAEQAKLLISPSIDTSLGALKGVLLWDAAEEKLPVPREFGDVALLSPLFRPESASIGSAPTNEQIYTVKKGDSLSKIASQFGISISTLVGANKGLTKSSKPKVGAELVIPAGLADQDNSDGLPEIKNYFIQPIEGFNWGKLHPKNAVDIANVCGTSIVASASGIVADTEMGETGYGHFVLIEHSNGTQTRYAHMDTISVSVGDQVKQGQKIGTVGKTGDATGCHVHFEVYGAKNPFAKN